MPKTGILFFGNRRFNRIWNTKTFVREQIRQAGNLLQTKKFIAIHANIFHNPLVGHTRFIQFGHDVSHQFDIVRTSCAVMPDGRCHPIG